MYSVGIFAIFDSKAEAYLQPFFSQNKATAIRAFSASIVKDQGFRDHAEDYTLFQIGEWNERLGELVNFESNLALGNGLEFRAQMENANGE